MGFFWFVVISSIGGSALMMIFTLMHWGKVEAEFDRKFEAIPDFTPTLSYKSSMCKNAIAIDVEHEKIATLLNPARIQQFEIKPYVYKFDDLLAVELVRDGASIVKTQRGSQLAGAVAGGLLLGPAGLIVGGLSGSKRQVSKIEKLSIKLYTNNLMMPVQELFFLDSPGAGADPQQIQHILQDLDQWHGRLRAIVENKRNASS